MELVVDEVTISYADSSEQMDSAGWLQAMASLHLVCVDIHSAIRKPRGSGDMSSSTAQMLLRVADWKNRLAVSFRDLNCSAPSYLNCSVQTRRAGIKLSCLYHELCLDVHCATATRGATSPALTVAHTESLASFFDWSSALTICDLIANS